ncbi:hypothetical protein [Pseudomonas ovata]|uniref:hypothetical protein n=1 Tax=Pseudomonas ovata TaxID=1839709 RepID=UPI000D689FB9|nr:hypothetical protein [Pseudomonas ovata]
MHDKCSSLNVIYAGRHFRFNEIGNERWYAAIDVVHALGLKDTPSMLRMIDPNFRIKMQFGQRHIHAINQRGLDQACLIAPTKHVEPLRLWLIHLGGGIEVTDRAKDPMAPVRKACADLTLDYLHQCRESLKKAGAAPVEWDEAKAQQAADGMASAIIRHRRWLVRFAEDGTPQLSSIPMDAMVMNLQTLTQWIQDVDGATPQQLLAISSALTKRLSNHESAKLRR